MRGWRTPIFVSFLLHGGLAATLVLMPETRQAPEFDQEPVQIEIVEREVVEEEPAPAEEVVEPTPAPLEEKKKKREKRREKRTTPVAPVTPPAGGEKSEDEGGGAGGVIEGTGPTVGTGTGRTKDGRDLSSLDLNAKVAVPRFEDQGPGVVLELEEKDPKRKPTKDGGWKYDDTAFGAHVRADGSVTFDDRGNSEVDLMPDGVKGGFDGQPSAEWTIDVNDWIMSALGDDPYSYEKRKFLEATREERLAMARAACGERLSSSLVDLPKRLSGVWNSNKTPEEKREVLFDLWDDCAEEGSPEVMRYGELARLTILDFIQKHLPEGSADAYTELEIDRLNQRRVSTRPFAPYGGRM